MRLRQAHQILIASGIVLFALFGVRGVAIWARARSGTDLAMGAGSLAVTVALVFYLRAIRAKWARDGK